MLNAYINHLKNSKYVLSYRDLDLDLDLDVDEYTADKQQISSIFVNLFVNNSPAIFIPADYNNKTSSQTDAVNLARGLFLYDLF